VRDDTKKRGRRLPRIWVVMIINMMEILNVMMMVVVMCEVDGVFLALLAACNAKPLL